MSRPRPSSGRSRRRQSSPAVVLTPEARAALSAELDRRLDRLAGFIEKKRLRRAAGTHPPEQGPWNSPALP